MDATSRELEAVSGPNGGYAWARLTVARSTVIGQLLAHAMDLGENSIFDGVVRINNPDDGKLIREFVPVPLATVTTAGK